MRNTGTGFVVLSHVPQLVANCNVSDCHLDTEITEIQYICKSLLFQSPACDLCF